MSDSSTGQIVGAIVGGVIGGVVAGPGGVTQGAAQGAAYGYAAGGIIDPPPGPSIKGPRIDDLSEQTASYGVGVADIDGTIAVYGNVIWIENNKRKEVAEKEDNGGKGGGGGGETTTYKYYGTFAVMLANHQVQGLRRLWLGPNLVLNLASNDIGTILAGDEIFPHGGLYAPGQEDLLKAALQTNPNPGPKGEIRFYPGFDDQMPDPRMEAALGVGNCPAYRGMPYLMFYDWPLEDYQNSIAGVQAKAELVGLGSVNSLTLLTQQTQDPVNEGTDFAPVCNYLSASKAEIYVPQWSSSYVTPTSLSLYTYELSSTRFSSTLEVSGGGFGLPYEDGEGPGVLQAGISDDPDLVLTGGVFGSSAELGDNSGFSDTTGRFVLKNGVFYGTYWVTGNIGLWRWLDNPIEGLRPNMNGAQYLATAVAYAITVDGSGTLYALFDGVIKTYDSTLTETGSKTLTFEPSSGAIFNTGAVHMSWSDGVIYIAFREWPRYIHAMPDDLSSDPGYLGDIGAPSGALWGSPVFSVESQILSRFGAYNDNSTIVERWRLPSLNGSTKPLADVVRERMERSELIETADINVLLLTDTVRGYRTSGIQSVRASLDPLISAYHFDIIPDGYQIKCIPRGQSSVATIDYDHLDARAYGSGAGPRLDQTREMDTQLPRKVVIKHLDDAREYDLNQQESPERQSSATVHVLEADLPIVFTPDEAAGIAEVVQYRKWLEREGFSFNLPPSYNALQPADVVTMVTPSATLELRLTSINYLTDGRLECQATLNDSAIYTPNAVGGTGATVTETLPYGGDSIMSLLDIPLILDAYDTTGFPAALCGLNDSWPGGVIAKSNDTGQTWKPVQGFTSPVTMGAARNSLPSHDGYVIDRDNTLTIDLYQSNMTLSSITEAQMLTGMNWFAYGADGRWEICRFATATLNADSSYTLDTLIRGARGTEWATGLHQDYDTFVFLSDADMAFIGADIQNLSVDRLYRGVTTAQDLDDVSDTAFSYDGVNLKPLSPVHLKGGLNVNDWDLSWTRRSRLSTSWWTTGVERLIGEASESWEIDIMNGSAVVRTLTSTTDSVTYTSAQQVTDFGSNQTTLTFRVYQISATVGRGYVAEVTV